MSIFSFFRHQKKKEPLPKKYSFDDLPSLIEGEIKEIQKSSERFKNELKSMVSQFSVNTSGNISRLKLLNLDKRKDESQRLKDIVMTNLNSYIFFLEKLVQSLDKIESESVEDYIGKVRFSFNNFNKSSRIIYERATILIGKELAEVRESVDNFAKEFNQKLATNKGDLERASLIKSLRDNLDKSDEAKRVQKQVESQIADFEDKKSGILKEAELTKNNQEAYIISEEYLVFVESREKINQENKILNDDILKLKQDINLRDLAKHFHNDPKKSEIVKRYSRDFSDSLKNDSNLEILSLIKEANPEINTEKISALRKNILDKKDLVEDAKLREFEETLLKLERELNQGDEEIRKEQDKIPKLKEKQDQMSRDIAEIAKKIWDDFSA